VLDALGDPSRRHILELLSHQARSVGELAGLLPIGRPAVSKHLRVLQDAGLVGHRSAGTRNVYALDPDGLRGLEQWLTSTWQRARTGAAAPESDRR
jgi:DNA-binding transcriptional ArsR family regulator